MPFYTGEKSRLKPPSFTVLFLGLIILLIENPDSFFALRH